MKSALRNLFSNRSKTAAEVEEELQFHLDMLEEKYAQQGMVDTSAKNAALKRFGNFERVKRQCVDISRRNSLVRRVLSTSSIVLALTGLLMHTLSVDYKVARVGTMLITIAIAARLLVYVRGLAPATFPLGSHETSLSVTERTEEYKHGQWR